VSLIDDELVKRIHRDLQDGGPLPQG